MLKDTRPKQTPEYRFSKPKPKVERQHEEPKRPIPSARARTRRSDPETSHEAADTVGDVSINMRYVWMVLKENGPLHHEALIEAYARSGLPAQSDSGIRTRCAELRDLPEPMVEWTGAWVRISNTTRSRVWRAIE